MSTQQRVDVRDGRGRDGRSISLPAGLSGLRGGSDRLPRPPGTRRPGLAVIAVLLIVLGGTVAGLLAVRIDQRQPVLVARADIAVGTQITQADLAVARIASDGIAVVPAKDAGQVIGHYATAPIGQGQLINAGELGTSGLLTPGNVAVGVSLVPGRYPASGLQSGDVVEVVRTVDDAGKANGKVLSESATVSSVHNPTSGTFSSSSSSNVVITLILDQAESTQVAAEAAAGQVTLVLVRRGG